MAHQTSRPAPGLTRQRTCATSLGGLCAVCVQLGNRSWRLGPIDSTRCRGLSPAARSRLNSCQDQPDLFEVDLHLAQRTTARIRDAASERYEILKGDVRRTAKSASQYESGIWDVVMRIGY